VKLTDKLEVNWFDERKRYPDKPNLLRATIRAMGWKPFLIGCVFIPRVNILHLNLILFDEFF
jgi:hypothetical protein